MDHYSKWIEIAKLDDLTSNNIICQMKAAYLMNLSATVVPSTQVRHLKILAGVMVLCTLLQAPIILNQMVKQNKQALLNYRNTHLDGIGLSPAQILIGRKLKTSLPTNADLLKLQDTQEIKQQLQKIKGRDSCRLWTLAIR